MYKAKDGKEKVLYLIQGLQYWPKFRCWRDLSPYLTGLRLLATNCEGHLRGKFRKYLEISSHESQRFAHMSLKIAIVKKLARQMFSQNTHRVIAGVWNPS